MDFFYQGAWRMDWGLGNPNKTATLIACLMISIWAMAYKWKEVYWLALPLFTVLGFCLVQTYSRGGMLALLAGVTILIADIPRPWPRARWIAAVASLLVSVVFIIFSNAQTRYGQALFGHDPSIGNRLLIWKCFPKMLTDAPSGWGSGNAGDAYTQWFQPPDQSENYLNLVNSHFTWMVEGGWVASVLYIYIWIAILLLCCRNARFKYKCIPLAVWVAFGVGGCFSHVEESIWLWILPLVCLGVVLWKRFQLCQWPTLSSAGLGLAVAFCIVGMVLIAGFTESSLPIKLTGQAIRVGNGPDVNVILVDRDVLGKLYGHTLRRYLEENSDLIDRSTFLITESPDYVIPSRVHQLIVSGRQWQDAGCLNMSRVEHIILINPSIPPRQFKWDDGKKNRTRVYFGEYSQSPLRSSWASYPGFDVQFIEGAADFVPSWPQAVLGTPGT